MQQGPPEQYAVARLIIITIAPAAASAFPRQRALVGSVAILRKVRNDGKVLIAKMRFGHQKHIALLPNYAGLRMPLLYQSALPVVRVLIAPEPAVERKQHQG